MNHQPTHRRRVTVIGAGVVGISCALHLLRDGHDVLVVDRTPPGEGCSKGNAGIFASYSFVPLSMPGTLGNVPGWFMDPLGPLAIRWRHAPRLLPWLVRFVRAGSPRRIEEICDALAPLLESSLAHHKDLAQGTDAQGLIRSEGCMYVYEDANSLAKDELAWKLRMTRGAKAEPLSAADIHARVPALSPIYEHGYFIPDLGYTVEPSALVKGLARHFEQSGGTVLRCEVRDIDLGTDGPRHLLTDDGSLDLDVLVIAAGAWSGPLAARLGSPVPLEAERGYHVTIADSGIALDCPIYSNVYKFIATPMAPGIRIAGTSEWAGLDAPPNDARAEALVKHARRMFPGIDTAQLSEWSGFRPTLPDSLPVIGPSPVFENVYFAFGHQHIGLTGGPRTGQVIADLVAGRTPNIDIQPFRADRF